MSESQIVETDLVTGASAPDPAAPADTPGPIFVEADDASATPAAAPAAASAPDVKAERLAHVKALAAETKALAAERARIAWERNREAETTATMRAELEALNADPWAYVKDRHQLTAAHVAERELFQMADESTAQRAERLATATQAKLDAILADARGREEAAQRAQTWETAKAAALKAFEAGAANKWTALDAFVTKTAEKTGQSKNDVLVAELLDTVERVRRDPKFGPHASAYSDEDYFKYMNERFSVVEPPKPAKEKSYKSRSADDSTMTKTDDPRAPFGSAAYRKKEAAEVVAAWRAARGDKPAEERTYSEAEIKAAEEAIIDQHGRLNKDADRKHTSMILQNARLAAKARARS